MISADKPGAPENVKPKEVYGENILLGWDAPKDDGGVPIKHYLVEYKCVSKRALDWTKAGEYSMLTAYLSWCFCSNNKWRLLV